MEGSNEPHDATSKQPLINHGDTFSGGSTKGSTDHTFLNGDVLDCIENGYSIEEVYLDTYEEDTVKAVSLDGGNVIRFNMKIGN